MQYPLQTGKMTIKGSILKKIDYRHQKFQIQKRRVQKKMVGAGVVVGTVGLQVVEVL